MTEEQFYHRQINLLRLEYEKAIKPYIDRLVYLKKIEPPKSICVALEQAAAIPPQRTWVGLTDDEVIQIRDDMTLDIRSHVDFYRHCEAKLKEKNT